MSEFRNVLEVLNDRQGIPRLTTGNADLDSLLGGGIEPGQFYLFYGEKDSGIDYLIHQILVNSLLPIEKFGFDGRCIYSNCGNYHHERNMLNTRLLCHLIKAARLDPVKALDDIYMIYSFSEQQQEQVFNEIQSLLEKDGQVKLVIVHNIARLFTPNAEAPRKNVGERVVRLQKLVSRIWQICARNNLPLVASCRPSENGKRRIPKPEGGKYLRHKATAIVHLKRKRRSLVSAYLVKHPSRPPREVSLESNLGGDLLGRITMPFRILLKEEMGNLKRTFREALMDVGRRDAFDILIKTWSSEQGAMSYARVPSALDVMLLTAAIDNRKAIEENFERIAAIESRLSRIEASIERLSYHLRDEDL